MRVVFMGTPEFSTPTLNVIAAEHDVVAVYTRPDAISGRGRTLRPSPVKVLAQELGLSVLQPPTLRDPAAVHEFVALSADICIVAAFGLILPADVLQAPRFGCINVHASLLPRWRGAAPVQRAILAGDQRTGVSIMRMEEGLDTGPYCAVGSTEVTEKDTTTLTSELGELGAVLIESALPSIFDGTATWVSQDESLATYAKKIEKDEVLLDPSLTCTEALRRIRASSSTAPARVCIEDAGITVISARPAPDGKAARGQVVIERSGALLGLADGALSLLAVKPDGKQTMDSGAWGRGLRFRSAEWKRP